MLRRILFPVALLAALALAPTLHGQECGDASGDGKITLGDPVRIIDYVAISGTPVDETTADCDGRTGVTLQDAQAIFLYLFYDFNPDHLNCTLSGSYSFSPIETDTVFVPSMTDIDESIETISLPLVSYWTENTNCMYLSFQSDWEDWGGYFYLESISSVNGGGSGHRAGGYWAMGANEYTPDITFDGYQTIFTLNFRRMNPGVATILYQPIEVSDPQPPSVGKTDGDLYTPVFATNALPAPVPQVTVAPTSLSFVARAGSWSQDELTLSFESNLGAVSFYLDALTEEGWLVIEDYQGDGYTTPCTVTIKAYAGLVSIGNHQGSIVIYNPDPEDAEFNTMSIPVDFTVTDPLVYPWGDVNCDGVISLGDISRLIDYLFLSQDPIEPCQ